jgi:tetratricopeptide (TPR) repeat protein
MLERFGIGKRRAQEAVLEEQVNALQGALARCKGVAMRLQRRRHWMIAGGMAGMLVLGFVLGVYREGLVHTTARIVPPVGLIGTRDNPEAGYVAYDKGNYENALKLLRPLAENGDARAQATIGLLYYRGRGVRQDIPEALKWFQLAAERGNPVAEFNLGVMHAEGQGVPQDNAEAAKWYRLAADQGHPPAQYNLGLWYANGDGGSADNVRAHMWFNLAAARFPPSDPRDRSIAANSRDAVASIMTPEQIAEAQKLAREWKPKEPSTGG